MIFIYDSLNEVISVMLNAKRSDIESIDSIDSKLFITLKRKEFNCPKCNRRLNLNGYFTRQIIIPNKAFEGIKV